MSNLNFVKLISCFTLSFIGIGNIYSQQCSPEAITAKYWQYRKDFNKHFIVQDRDSSGCIHDGIGQDTSNRCFCEKEGYGLPATSYIQC